MPNKSNTKTLARGTLNLTPELVTGRNVFPRSCITAQHLVAFGLDDHTSPSPKS